MNGPLASERPMVDSLLGPPRHDVAVGRPRTAPGLVALRRLAPGRHRMIALPLALAAAHRVIDGVHHRAAHRRPEPLPPHAAGLADRDVLVIEIADLADRRHAVELHLADLAGRELQVRVVAFLGQELGKRARAPAELATLAR